MARQRSDASRTNRVTYLSVTSALAVVAQTLTMSLTSNMDNSSDWVTSYLDVGQVWKLSRGAGVAIAVLDTGCAPISDLAGSLEYGADYSNGPTSIGNGQIDSSGHGTEIAIAIVGKNPSFLGLAPMATILPIRIGVTDGSQPTEFASAVRFAIERKVGVINLSFSGDLDPGTDISAMIDSAARVGIVVVAASGNDGNSHIDYPAAFPGVISVGAVDHTGTIWPESNTGRQLVLSAPGVDVPSEDEFEDDGTSTGTSDAAAFVSATAALVRSEHPDWTAGQVIRVMLETALPGPGQVAGQRDDQYGYGIINPLGALEAAAPEQTSNPLLTAASDGGQATASADAGRDAALGNEGDATLTPTTTDGPKLIMWLSIAIALLLGIGALIAVIGMRNRQRAAKKAMQALQQGTVGPPSTGYPAMGQMTYPGQGGTGPGTAGVGVASRENEAASAGTRGADAVGSDLAGVGAASEAGDDTGAARAGVDADAGREAGQGSVTSAADLGVVGPSAEIADRFHGVAGSADVDREGEGGGTRAAEERAVDARDVEVREVEEREGASRGAMGSGSREATRARRVTREKSGRSERPQTPERTVRARRQRRQTR